MLSLSVTAKHVSKTGGLVCVRACVYVYAHVCYSSCHVIMKMYIYYNAVFYYPLFFVRVCFLVKTGCLIDIHMYTKFIITVSTYLWLQHMIESNVLL